MDNPIIQCRRLIAHLARWALILLAVAVFYLGIIRVLRGVPEPFDDEVEHLKYGSIGSDTVRIGIPDAFFRVMPKVFSHLLPHPNANSYEAMGFIYEARMDRPIGFSKRRIGLPYRGFGLDLVGINCGMCHASAIRPTNDGPQTIIAGMPGHTADVEAFFVFLFKVARDPHFIPEVMLGAIEEDRNHEPLGLLPRIGYRLLTYVAQFQISRLETKLCFVHNAPTACEYPLTKLTTAAGPGRIDTWATYKILRPQTWPDLHEQPYVWLRLDLLARLFDSLPEIPLPVFTSRLRANGEMPGFADAPDIWKLEDRIGRGFHWDGNTHVLTESAGIAAVGLTSPANIDKPALRRIAAWARTASPPKWGIKFDPQTDSHLSGSGRGRQPSDGEGDGLAPVDKRVNKELKDTGERLYLKHCASCHSPTGEWFGRSLPIAEIGTDRNRYDAFTDALAVKFNTKAGVGYDWQPRHFSAKEGYSSVPLDGIWLRAPYLHNGSVPTLWHLLHRPCDSSTPFGEQQSCRPTVFYRGNDVYDWKNVGFVWNEPERGAFKFFPYDTTIPGNGNGGHLFGTDLKDDEKTGLLEFLKTL